VACKRIGFRARDTMGHPMRFVCAGEGGVGPSPAPWVGLLVCIFLFTGCASCVTSVPASKAQAQVVDEDASRIWMPVVDAGVSGKGHDPIMSWFQIGETDLIVLTAHHAIRLHGRSPVWTRRFRFLGEKDFSRGNPPPAYGCKGLDGLLFLVHPSGGAMGGMGESSVVLSAVSFETGELLAQGIHALPKGVDPRVLAMIPWKDGAMVLFGPSNVSHAQVEAARRFSFEGGQIRASLLDLADLTGWTYFDQRRDPCGESVVLAKRQDGNTRVQVIRNRGRGVRSITIRMGEDDWLQTWALDVQAHDVLVVRGMMDGMHVLMAFDLISGRKTWTTASNWLFWGDGAELAVGTEHIYGLAHNIKRLMATDRIMSLAIRSGTISMFESRNRKGPLDTAPTGPVVCRKGATVMLALHSLPTVPHAGVFPVCTFSETSRKLLRCSHVKVLRKSGQPVVKRSAFLLPSSNGLWHGLDCGVVAYWRFGGKGTAEDIRLPSTASPATQMRRIELLEP